MGMHYLALHWDQILKVVGTMTSSKIKSKSNHDGAQYELPIPHGIQPGQDHLHSQQG